MYYYLMIHIVFFFCFREYIHFVYQKLVGYLFKKNLKICGVPPLFCWESEVFLVK